MWQANGFRFDLREAGGALGDLGTLLPLMLGAIAVVGLAPVPVLLGFALAYIGTAFAYRLPIPVQPMKAVAAVLLTAEATPASLAAAGVMLGAALLLLGWTGWIDRLGRLLPQSVLAGLQLGLGATLALTSLGLLAATPWLGLMTLLVLLGLLRVPRVPAALVAIVLATLAGHVLSVPVPPKPDPGSTPLALGLTSWAELEQAFTVMVLPQLSLTLANAVLLTALVAGDCFGERARRVTPRRLAVSSGVANLVLTALGALPMCHGAGGVVAHHRFGARSGGAPLMLGLALLVVALLPGGAGLALLGAVPAAGLGALLLVAAVELAVSRRLWDCRPSCYPVIVATALVTVVADPFWGFVAGAAAEASRVALLGLLRRHS